MSSSSSSMATSLAEIAPPHLGIGAHRLRSAVGNDAALVQQRDRLVRLARRHPGCRLVEQQDLGIAGQREAKLELLLVAVRERAGDRLCLLGEADREQQGQTLLAAQRLGASPE